MIAISAASGQLGRHVIETLLKTQPDTPFVALARRPESLADFAERGVTVRYADYNEPASLLEALEGVNRLLMISSSEVGQRVAQHQAIIDAAKAKNLSFVAYTSILHCDTSPLSILADEHAQTEQALADSGLKHALLRNGWYSENYLQSVGAALEHGTLLGCAGEGRFATASRQDFAEAAVKVLTETYATQETQRTVYELAGDTAFTLAEFAAAISEISAKPVAYRDMPEQEYTQALIGMGLPEVFAHMLANSESGAKAGGLYDESRQLATLIGRATTPWQETLREALSQ